VRDFLVVLEFFVFYKKISSFSPPLGLLFCLVELESPGEISRRRRVLRTSELLSFSTESEQDPQKLLTLQGIYHQSCSIRRVGRGDVEEVCGGQEGQ